MQEVNAVKTECSKNMHVGSLMAQTSAPLRMPAVANKLELRPYKV
jgi:hypothetical protein